jgi:hypothetical protein
VEELFFDKTCRVTKAACPARVYCTCAAINYSDIEKELVFEEHPTDGMKVI